MVPLADLKKIIILDSFTDEMLTKFQPLVRSQNYSQNDLVFNENAQAESFYMILSGKVLLEKKIAESVTISLGAIKMGYSFGWSTILGKIPFSLSARCAEKSTILCVDGEDVFDLFSNEPYMAYLFMRHLGNIMKNRLDRMEERLIRSLREHPDFKPLLE